MLVDSDSSFTKAFTLTILARLAKFNVDRVYWKHNMEVVIVATMKVLELPPRLSRRRQVSFESRQGMWTLGRSLANALITMPKVVRDLLIFPAYFSRSPVAIVIFCRSEPARSTKCNFGVFRTFFPSISDFMASDMVKIECDLEDSLFICVSPMCLFFIPIIKQSINLSALSADSQVKFSTNTPFFTSCLMLSVFLSLPRSSKSMICSLQSSKYEQVTIHSESVILSILLKSSLKDFCIMPLLFPIIVQVFPDPVCPQTKMQLLQPSRVWVSSFLPTAEKMSSCCAEGPKMRSNPNEWRSSLISLWVQTAESSQQPGLMRTTTWMESPLEGYQ